MKRFFIAATLVFLLTGCATHNTVYESPEFTAAVADSSLGKSELHGRAMEWVTSTRSMRLHEVKYESEERGRILATASIMFAQDTPIVGPIDLPVYFDISATSQPGLLQLSMLAHVAYEEEDTAATRARLKDRFDALIGEFVDYIKTNP